MLQLFKELSEKKLGGCPRIEDLLRKSWIWPDCPIIFVKYSKYSPQIMKKSRSNHRSLATVPILGQPPRFIPIKIVKHERVSFCVWVHIFLHQLGERMPKSGFLEGTLFTLSNVNFVFIFPKSTKDQQFFGCEIIVFPKSDLGIFEKFSSFVIFILNLSSIFRH